MARFAALILAAGYGSRMGRFKPLLPLAGKNGVEWVVAAFRAAGVADIAVVTGDVGSPAAGDDGDGLTCRRLDV